MASDIYDSMAEGVQHAAVIVCFMSQQYEDSKNCALELKFAAQTGVPIVPVMVQSDFTAYYVRQKASNRTWGVRAIL